MSEFNNRGMLFKSEDLIKEIQYDGNEQNTFKIKAILPTDIGQISRMRAARQGSLPANMFTEDELAVFDMEASIDFAVQEWPDWCSSESVDSLRQTEMRTWLSNEINKWSNEWQTRLKKNKHKPNKRSSETRVPD